MNPLPATESAAAWVAWNDTVRTGLAATLPHLVEAQARRTPDHPAVVHDRTTLTYRELNERANRLARVLVARGAGPEDLVAVAVPRSERTLLASLAVAKAGAAYAPVDTGSPAARIAALLGSAAPLLTLTTEAVEPQLPADAPVLMLDDPETAESVGRQDPADLTDGDRRGPLAVDNAAYVIHTSGSTGAPKGVVVTHAGLASLAVDHIERFGITEGDGVLQFASFSFDCSVGDMLMARLVGLLDAEQPLYGLQARALTRPDLAPASTAEMAADYAEQIRSVTPHGPYLLLGWSSGGRIAHEVATRLRASGERVALLALLDAEPAHHLAAPGGPDERYEPTGTPRAHAPEVPHPPREPQAAPPSPRSPAWRARR
ncbi:AMP-binding protein [Streptomyces buecherae]|uniref:AMP-binding protein n=1 Tax=Streptomyces buecherae TaxID=2763006 RepID=UPI0037910467